MTVSWLARCNGWPQRAWPRVLVLTGLLMAAAPVRAEPASLRMGYGGTWTMPWGQIVGGEVVAGINRDIGLAVAERLGRKLEFVFLTERRAHEANLERPYDLGCGMDPSWFPDAHRFQWSPPLFEVSDRLVGHRSQRPITQLADVPKGAVVGTVRAYRYPTLQVRFANGSLRREDARDQAGALQKLSRRRTDWAVVSQQALDWYRQQHPEHELAAWSVIVQRAGYHCAVPEGANVEPSRVLEALASLEREGAIHAILARYAPAPAPQGNAP
ncbi:substrate-binding periplasmic protein [Inhella gelatinilytica]|uniref:Transporter substrate-binding domain-containing protein n=1 Tax=Inhella gelatinilytica TaxID=2795030 RepID=A0A931IY71_9BURK|nr:transporter substrate-binding domain-containing protein [Inhella gelatinilytica]MBH9553170.1 transporter substrate-binding domain-containing protein [Inhella gelatinilytica]